MELSLVAIRIRALMMFYARAQWSLVPAAWLLAAVSFAQEVPHASAPVVDANVVGEVTVASGLEMARRTAEQAGDPRTRVMLRSRVAQSTERGFRTSSRRPDGDNDLKRF